MKKVKLGEYSYIPSQMLKLISLCLEIPTQCSTFMNVAASMAEGTTAILIVMFQVTNVRFVFTHPTLPDFIGKVQQSRDCFGQIPFKIILPSVKLLVTLKDWSDT
jgi:hypothetical protein